MQFWPRCCHFDAPLARDYWLTENLKPILLVPCAYLGLRNTNIEQYWLSLGEMKILPTKDPRFGTVDLMPLSG